MANNQLKLKRGKVITLLKKFLSLFKRKPEIVNLSGEELKDKAIYISNHAGANGPMTYEMYFPKRITPWGAHEMCEGIKSRWNYLYNVFYRQKLHWGKFRAFIVATLFSPISILLYRGVGLIPTYKDSRFLSSLKQSCRVLDQNSAILVFPEDSEEGYKNPPEALHGGFVALSKVYKRLRGESLPVYICYFNTLKKKILISEPFDVHGLLSNGVSEKEVVNAALEVMHNLSAQTAD